MKELLREFLKNILTEAPANKTTPQKDRLVKFGNSSLGGKPIYLYGPVGTPENQRGVSNATHYAAQGQTKNKRPITQQVRKQLQSQKKQDKKPSTPGVDGNIDQPRTKPAPKKSQEPAYTPPAGEQEAPTRPGNANAKPIEKTKELDQLINSADTFNTDEKFAADGVSDSEFTSNPEVESSALQISPDELEKFFIDGGGKTLFPRKYIKVLSRLLSTKAGSLRISDFTNASGAGTLSSTTGELLTLMGMSINDDEMANQFFALVESHVKKNVKAKDSIIDVAWVRSAKKVRSALRRRYDSIYGEGQWSLGASAWDIQDEVEALGLPDYKNNKGFSTDIYLQVNVGGKKVLDEISLKKDLRANLLNATSGRVPDIMVYGAASDEDRVLYEDLNAGIAALAGNTKAAVVRQRNELIRQRDAIIEKYNADVPDEVRVEKVTARQQQLYQDYVTQSLPEIKKFASDWSKLDANRKAEIIRSIVTSMNQKESYGKELAVALDKLSKSEFSSPEKFMDGLKNIIGKNDQSKKQKFMLSMMYGIQQVSTEGSQAQKFSDAIVQNSHTHSKAVRNFLLTDERARRGLLLSIRDAFPLKALFEGEETMALGDVVVDRKVLTSMFNTQNFGEIEQKLTVRDEPPPPSIVYRVVGKEDIPIAEISSRPDGIGYGGTWKLEMSVHEDFADLLKAQNNTLYPN